MNEKTLGADAAAVATAEPVATTQLSHAELGPVGFGLTTVELDPAVWHRGQGKSNSLLLREDGRMCCIGIACRACGVEDNKLRGMSVLTRSLAPLANGWGESLWLASYNNDFRVYAENDAVNGFSDLDRVAAINADLHKQNIPLRFTLKSSQAGTEDAASTDALGSVPSEAQKG